MKMYSAAPVRNFWKKALLWPPCGTSPRRREPGTGSIYTRFTDKAGLFRALVEPAAGELKRRFLEIQESFHRFDGPTQQEEMGRYTAHAQEGLFDYIYEHLPEFELLLRRAAGTEYAHYIDELVEIEVSYTYKYMEVIGCESVRSGQVTEDLIHIVTTAYFNGMFEPVRHRMDKARALHYIRQLNRYHMAGFETIFHPENFRLVQKAASPAAFS